jgi:5'-nucleotidase
VAKENRDDLYILVTNDDGVRAEGIRNLRAAVEDMGRVIVVAPEQQQSASSHALTLSDPLRINWLDDSTIAVDGTPTDCVLVAMRGLLERKPDLLVSGINHGPNLGDDVTYSGTVAAAFEGTLLGIPSIAMSVASWHDCKFDAAREFARVIVSRVLEEGLAPNTLLNVNVPSCASKGVSGVRVTKLGKRVYRDVIVKKKDPRGRDYYWIGGGDPVWEPEGGTDFEAIEQNAISVTPLHLDLTDYKQLEVVKKWNLSF